MHNVGSYPINNYHQASYTTKILPNCEKLNFSANIFGANIIDSSNFDATNSGYGLSFDNILENNNNGVYRDYPETNEASTGNRIKGASARNLYNNNVTNMVTNPAVTSILQRFQEPGNNNCNVSVNGSAVGQNYFGSSNTRHINNNNNGASLLNNPPNHHQFINGGNISQQQQQNHHLKLKKSFSLASPASQYTSQQQQQPRYAKGGGLSPSMTAAILSSPSTSSIMLQNAVNSTSRYKTELCRPFEESGECKYGDKCQFAHGMCEMRNLSRHPKYKTEFCRTFHSIGFCPYGPRCHFIHNGEEVLNKMPAPSPPHYGRDLGGGMLTSRQSLPAILSSPPQSHHYQRGEFVDSTAGSGHNYYYDLSDSCDKGGNNGAVVVNNRRHFSLPLSDNLNCSPANLELLKNTLLTVINMRQQQQNNEPLLPTHLPTTNNNNGGPFSSHQKDCTPPSYLPTLVEDVQGNLGENCLEDLRSLTLNSSARFSGTSDGVGAMSRRLVDIHNSATAIDSGVEDNNNVYSSMFANLMNNNDNSFFQNRTASIPTSLPFLNYNINTTTKTNNMIIMNGRADQPLKSPSTPDSNCSGSQDSTSSTNCGAFYSEENDVKNNNPRLPIFKSFSNEQN